MEQNPQNKPLNEKLMALGLDVNPPHPKGMWLIFSFDVCTLYGSSVFVPLTGLFFVPCGPYLYSYEPYF